MSRHAYHELNYHFCWATRDRQRLISRSWRPTLLRTLAECVRKNKGIPVRQNAMPDHVHLLVKLSPSITISDFVNALQIESAHRLHREVSNARTLAWSPNYGVLTFRSDDIQKVSGYIDRQESQHASGRLSHVLEQCEDVDSEEHSQPFHALYFHLTWGTLRRESLLRKSWRPRLLNVLAEEVPKRGGTLIAHNAMPDHVHLLVKLPPDVSVSGFAGAVKGGCSHRVNQEIQPGYPVKWQQGFGAVSVRDGDLETVTQYIKDQEEHHRRQTLWMIMEKLHAF